MELEKIYLLSVELEKIYLPSVKKRKEILFINIVKRQLKYKILKYWIKKNENEETSSQINGSNKYACTITGNNLEIQWGR